MKSAVFDGKLQIVDRPTPVRKAGWVLLRVTCAGICNTDHEILKGYVPGFNGILGHEFIGIIEEADDTSLIGKRATAEINNACGECDFCKQGMRRHCTNRTVMGIINAPGAFAEYVCAPFENVYLIADDIPDSSAIFIEPLAAAREIMEQVPIGSHSSVLVIGDGKLACLIALAIQKTECRLKVMGKHQSKLTLLKNQGINTVLLQDFKPEQYDVVVEASGNPSAFEMGISCTKPRGTFVLKSTYAGELHFNPSPIVVNEITLVGSRCGRFSNSIAFIRRYKPPLEKCITAEFPLDRIGEAFAQSEKAESLKVILRI